MADVPPELAAEVQKLERYHADNPQGRYFVPLANAYRKMGALDQAEALLREGLRRHPDYLSAHIVLGRCLADRGATADAVGEFRYVLSVDPQNLIALRSLGEMASEGGRTDEAARWYRELLAVDPMNEDARQALEALESRPAPAADEGAAWWERPGEEAAADEGLAGAGIVDDDVIWSSDAQPAGDEPAGEDALSWGAVDLDTTLGLDVPADDATPAEPFASAPFGDLELADAAPAGERAELEEHAEAAEPPAAWGGGDAPGGWDPYSGTTVDLDVPSLGGDEADAGEGEGDEVVTETIAELYARQGFHDRAADVYRELIRRRGGDPALEARLREEERLAAGEPPAMDELAPGAAAASEVSVEAAEPATATDDIPLLEWSVSGMEVSEAEGFTLQAPDAGLAEPEPYPLAMEEGEDAFAASFEGGFGEAEPPAAGAPEEDAPGWAPAASEADEVAAIFAREEALFAPLAEEPPPLEEPAGEEPLVAAGGADEPFAAAPPYAEPSGTEPAPEPAAVEQPEEAARVTEFRTVRAYLAGIASWQPAGAAAVQAPAEPEASFDEVPATTVDELPAGAEPAAAAFHEAAAADEEDDMPWLAAPVSEGPGPGADEAPMEIDGLLEAESAGAAASAGSGGEDDEPYPWELAPAGGEAAASPAPEEPAAAPGPAFSFEEFFVEPAVPEPPRVEQQPAQPSAAGAGEDEDLESFQAWLQSLKR